jgi:hypothetical protein
VKIGTRVNSPLAFEHDDLDVIDEAIDRAIDEGNERKALPLFDPN